MSPPTSGDFICTIRELLVYLKMDCRRLLKWVFYSCIDANYVCVMKAEFDIKKIKVFVVSLALIAFSLGGWILFISSEVKRHKELTREINLQTIEILNQMHRCNSVYSDICSIRE